MFLKVEASNEAARAMYGELGYEVVSMDGAPSKQICAIVPTLSWPTSLASMGASRDKHTGRSVPLSCSRAGLPRGAP